MWLPLEYLSIKVPLPAAEHQGLTVWHQLDMKLLLIGLLHPDIIAKPVGSFTSEIAQQRQDILRTVVSHTLAKFSLNLEPYPDRVDGKEDFIANWQPIGIYPQMVYNYRCYAI